MRRNAQTAQTHRRNAHFRAKPQAQKCEDHKICDLRISTHFYFESDRIFGLFGFSSKMINVCSINSARGTSESDELKTKKNKTNAHIGRIEPTN